jgi:Fe-S cluster assembly iron-binding protein IscA
MITITESAWQRLADVQSKHTDVTALRLKLKDGCIKCHRGVRRPSDQVLKSPKRPALLVSEALAQHLSSSTLDTRVTNHGLRLRLKFRGAKSQPVSDTRNT